MNEDNDLIEETSQEDQDLEAIFNASVNQAIGRSDDDQDDSNAVEDEVADQEEDEPQAEEQAEIEETIDEISAIKAELDELRALKSKVGEFVDQNVFNQRTQELFGRLGSLQQELRESKAKAAEFNPEDLPELIADDLFAELKEDYGDDFAANVTSGIQRALAKVLPHVLKERTVKVEQPFDVEPLGKAIDARLAEFSDGLERKTKLLLLQQQHPDLSTVLESNEFQQWKETKGDSVKQVLEYSNDIFEISRVLSDYKESLKAKAEKAAKNTNRLTNAIPLKTASQPPVKLTSKTPEQVFEESFRRVRGG